MVIFNNFTILFKKSPQVIFIYLYFTILAIANCCKIVNMLSLAVSICCTLASWVSGTVSLCQLLQVMGLSVNSAGFAGGWITQCMAGSEPAPLSLLGILC